MLNLSCKAKAVSEGEVSRCAQGRKVHQDRSSWRVGIGGESHRLGQDGMGLHLPIRVRQSLSILLITSVKGEVANGGRVSREPWTLLMTIRKLES